MNTKTKTETAVIFRTFINGGDVVALFPFEPSDAYGHHCLSYQSVGQHAGASPDLMNPKYTRPATASEALNLANELSRIGYLVKPMLRFPRNAFKIRQQKAPQV